MATEKQIAANQRNAERSTGPKSAEGKAKVARNALKHGLAGHGVIVPEEMAGQIHDRMNFLRPSYRPDSPAQEWLFVRICIETVRADSCLHQLIALRDEAALRAGESWDDDRALEAEELGAGIGRRPELRQPKLMQSKHGALWLLAQWEELERQLELTGEWTEAASTRGMDLLGVAIDARVGVWERLAGGDPRALIRRQVTAIEDRIERYLEARDDRARSDAEAGIGVDGPDVRRVLRYESAALRRLQVWTRELRRLQNPATAPNRRRSPHSAIAEAPEPDESAAARATADPARRAGSLPGIAAMPGALRGSLAPEGPAIPSNRHARRARAALERRARRA